MRKSGKGRWGVVERRLTCRKGQNRREQQEKAERVKKVTLNI